MSADRHITHVVSPPKVTETPLSYTENTLFKVYDALRAAGLDESSARDCISEMQNAGIYFRERIEPPLLTLNQPTTTCRSATERMTR
jgi:hypothetical protein